MKANVNSINLFYEKSGRGIPLLLLHGNGEDHRIFDKLVSKLNHRFTVYALDSRGHGQSSKNVSLSYSDMAEDIAEFIKTENLYKPLLVGFSDGGIIGITLAIKYPDLLGGLLCAGANLNPSGLKNKYLFPIKLFSLFSPLMRLMAKEPNIDQKELEKITVPTVITAGERDMIKEKHTLNIASSIKNSVLYIFEKKTHGSYVLNSEKLAPLILELALARDFSIGKKESVYFLTENVNKIEPEQYTTVTAKETDENLIFLFEAEENCPCQKGEKDNDPLYLGDVVEIFLTLSEKNKYLEIEVNPAGLLFSAVVVFDKGKTNLTMLENSPAKTEVIKEGNKIISTIYLNKNALSSLGFKPENAFINLFRQDFKEGILRLSALAPTLSDTFHKPEFFKKVVFIQN